MAVTGNQIGKQVLAALGMEGQAVTKLVLTIEVGEPVTLDVTRFASADEMVGVVKEIARYRLETDGPVVIGHAGEEVTDLESDTRKFRRLT